MVKNKSSPTQCNQSKQRLDSASSNQVLNQTTRDFATETFPAFFTAWVTYFSAQGTACIYTCLRRCKNHSQDISKINSTHLKSHELVIRFRGPSINFDLVLRCNGKKFYAVKIDCNTKERLINVPFSFGSFVMLSLDLQQRKVRIPTL